MTVKHIKIQLVLNYYTVKFNEYVCTPHFLELSFYPEPVSRISWACIHFIQSLYPGYPEPVSSISWACIQYIMSLYPVYPEPVSSISWAFTYFILSLYPFYPEPVSLLCTVDLKNGSCLENLELHLQIIVNDWLEASLKVPEFSMCVYGSSCNYLIFGHILSSLLFFFFLFLGIPSTNRMGKQRNRNEAGKRDNYMNCSKQKW